MSNLVPPTISGIPFANLCTSYPIPIIFVLCLSLSFFPPYG